MFRPTVLSLVLAGLTAAFGAHAAPRPNIVLIMSDDMGYSDLGCYGGEIKTPNLDQLAAKGLRFTQFYNTGRCCPTRASLLTGLYPHQAGVGHMMADYGLPQYQGKLNTECVTIAEALKPAGYRTYMSGKWHVTPYDPKELAHPDRSNWPRQRGFDHFYGTIHGAGSFFDPNSLTRDNTHISPAHDPDYQPETYYYTDAISDHAVRFIKDHESSSDQEPFFLYVAYTAAHWPMQALPQDIARYEGKYDGGYAPIRHARLKKMDQLELLPRRPDQERTWDITPQTGNWAQVENKEWESACMEVYAAMVDNMDQGIGRIVKALKTTGELDNTLVLFLQDNGGCAENFGRGKREGPRVRPGAPTLAAMAPDELQTEMIPPQSRDGYPLRRGKGVLPGPAETQLGYGRDWANVSNTPFREYKHWVHEGGIATPLIAHWPKGLNVNHHDKRLGNFTRQTKLSGPLCHEPTHLIDVMATCLDLAGADYPANKIPVEGASLKEVLRGGALERDQPIFWEHEGNRAVREGDWKLVAKGVKGAWELYNMAEDRTEMHNLADTHPERRTRMSAQYEKWARERGVVPFNSWRNEPKPGKAKKKTTSK